MEISPFESRRFGDRVTWFGSLRCWVSGTACGSVVVSSGVLVAGLHVSVWLVVGAPGPCDCVV